MLFYGVVDKDLHTVQMDQLQKFAQYLISGRGGGPWWVLKGLSHEMDSAFDDMYG